MNYHINYIKFILSTNIGVISKIIYLIDDMFSTGAKFNPRGYFEFSGGKLLPQQD